ncbi:thiamine phosphate synthase [Sandaracinus amylolyticus]|uniref:thiamine phosphate synthase n=1 Tax=Sandaracinus amylolyticus TaxID=927083 RepID=UPI001F3D3A7C|nr:thiamine phosphate synthase [Sandaracinus amylolyticus]
MRGLYAIVDPERCAGRDPLEVASAILRGGCAIIQVRAKRMPDRERLALMRAVRSRAKERGVPFVVNDRPDLALLVDADGLHLGQDDLPIAEARRIVGRMMIGRSTHDLAQLRVAMDEGANLVGFGPVFATKSKENPDPVVGLEGLARAVRVARVPIVAIGGITEASASGVARTGVALGAAIAAIGEAPDPEQAARALHRALSGSTG